MTSSFTNAEKRVALFSEDRELSRPKGAKPLKKVSPRHRTLVALVLEGYSNNDIATILGMTPSRVSIVRNDPLVQSILQSHLDDADHQLASLFPRAVETLRQGLEDPDMKIALKASEQFFRTQGKFKETPQRDAAATAEDVAKQIVHIHNEGPTQVVFSGESDGVPSEAIARPEAKPLEKGEFYAHGLAPRGVDEP